MTKKEFLASVEAFLAVYKYRPTRLGVDALRDPQFVFNLRKGRECREATQERVLGFMEQKAKEFRQKCDGKAA